MPGRSISSVWVLCGALLFASPAACSGGDDGASGTGGSPGGGSGGVSGASGAGGSGGSAGSGGTAPAPDVTKFDILGAGADSALHDAVCASAGMPQGCDVCDASGYFGDGECDDTLIAAGLCDGTDPDCSPSVANYYVAPDGDDANDGSESAPFGTIQRAHDAAGPGDLIYLRGGTYHPSDTTVFTKEGTTSAPIVLRAYPGESPVIDASALPEGDVDGASTLTWYFRGAKHWTIQGPIHLTQGRGSGVTIEEDTQSVDFVRVESSYNGQTASRGGHGFLIVEDEWADVSDVRFVNCDAHHNANHRTVAGEDVAENLYQHGDGFRIKSGKNVRLTGCRAWNNLDDGYDLVWAAEPIVLYNCWAAYTGKDDAAGTITGTPGFEAAWGEGIKLGYTDDTGDHACIRCLSWNNVHLGYRMDGGPNRLWNCSSYRNGRRALGWDLGTRPHELRNNLDFDTLKPSIIPDTTLSEFNTWDEATGVTVSAEDFASLDDGPALGARSSDGSLPVVPFLRLASGSDLVDAGTDVGLFSSGDAPDLGCFERP